MASGGTAAYSDLRKADLLAVLDAASACAGAPDLVGFADVVVEQLPALIPCDVASYNELSLHDGGGWGRTNVPELLPRDAFDILSRYGHEHPVIGAAGHRTTGAPEAWSDTGFLSDLHRTNLYNLLYRHIGVEDQLSGVLESTPGYMAGVAVGRTRPGFSSRDRSVMRLFCRQMVGIRSLLMTRNDGPPNENSQCAWKVKLLGGLEIVGPAGRVRLEGRPAQLVKMVALAGGPVPAEQVMEELWPGVDLGTGRERLRVVLHRLPRDPVPVVERNGDALKLGPEVSVDAAAFEATASNALSADRRGLPTAPGLGEAALALYPADLLPEDLYDDCVAGPRERLRRRRLEVLDMLADHSARQHDAVRAISYLADAVAADPVDERRQVALGRLLLEAGRRGAVLELVERVERLGAELGIQPSAELAALRTSALG